MPYLTATDLVRRRQQVKFSLGSVAVDDVVRSQPHPVVVSGGCRLARNYVFQQCLDFARTGPVLWVSEDRVPLQLAMSASPSQQRRLWVSRLTSAVREEISRTFFGGALVVDLTSADPASVTLDAVVQWCQEFHRRRSTAVMILIVPDRARAHGPSVTRLDLVTQQRTCDFCRSGRSHVHEMSGFTILYEGRHVTEVSCPPVSRLT